jgi:serine/threonine-protein kinase SRPK3
MNEINMLRHLALKAAGSNHPGLHFTRLTHESFQIEGPAGQHHCVVFDPQGNSLRALQELMPGGMLPKLIVRSSMHRVLFAMNWLHLECGVIHTGT